MELVHLECFVTLADELHFGRAAARLHVGTSALSKRISELERRLGVRLFDRTSRDVRLTPEGETLLGQAQVALADIGVLRTMAADAAAGAIGGIRAAYSPGTGETMTGAVITAVRERLDRVRSHDKGSLADRILAIGRDCAKRFGPEYRALDHDAMLYDKDGLPR